MSQNRPHNATKPKLNVTNFPRPPLLERTARHLQIRWDDVVVADTTDAYWVLETHHPPSQSPSPLPPETHTHTHTRPYNRHNQPAYYLPRSSLLGSKNLTPTPHRTLCEYKGTATYHALTHPTSRATVANRIWSYENPTAAFAPIRGYLSFYAGGGVPWECWVDGEKVVPQEGGFYGGWVTGDVGGVCKGGVGTGGW